MSEHFTQSKYLEIKYLLCYCHKKVQIHVSILLKINCACVLTHISLQNKKYMTLTAVKAVINGIQRNAVMFTGTACNGIHKERHSRPYRYYGR